MLRSAEADPHVTGMRRDRSHSVKVARAASVDPELGRNQALRSAPFMTEITLGAEGSCEAHLSEHRSTRRHRKTPDDSWCAETRRRVVWTDAWRLGKCLLPGIPLDAEAGKLNFKALLHQRVRCAAQPLPVAKRPILPWALVPFKVPYLPLPVPMGNRFPNGKRPSSEERRKRCSTGGQEIPLEVRLVRRRGKPRFRALPESKLAEAALKAL